MYKPENFELYELLPKDVYEATMNYGERRWQWFDSGLLVTLQELRNNEGKIILNDWYWGGNNHYRGYRPFDCKVGAEWSMHKFFRALDCIFVETTAVRVRSKLLENPSLYPHITCIETEINWFHYDTRNWDIHKHGVLIV